MLLRRIGAGTRAVFRFLSGYHVVPRLTFTVTIVIFAVFLLCMILCALLKDQSKDMTCPVLPSSVGQSASEKKINTLCNRHRNKKNSHISQKQ